MKLSKLINDHLKTKERNSRKPKPRSYFYITEAGKKPYEIYKSLLLKRKAPPKVRRLREIGRKTHRRVYRYLEDMGLLKAREVKVGDDLFHGYVDAITHLPYEKPMPLEIKTVSRQDFEKILKRGRPSWQSYAQLQLYLNYLRKANKGRILYIETNTLDDYVMPLEEYREEQRMKEFIVRKNPKMIRNTIQKFRKLKDVFVRDGVMLKK